MSEVTLFIGDSVTDCGRSAANPWGTGYVRDIAESHRLEGAILNKGTSGHRLIDLEQRWESDVVHHSPSKLSINIGINDTWRRYDSNDPTSTIDFADRYRKVLDLTLSKLDVEIVLCEPFLLAVNAEMVGWREDLDPKIETIQSLAKEFSATLIPFDSFFTASVKEYEIKELAEDGIHPTPLGHKMMAEFWLQCLNL